MVKEERIRSVPGNSTLPLTISATIQPTDHTSTTRWMERWHASTTERGGGWRTEEGNERVKSLWITPKKWISQINQMNETEDGKSDTSDELKEKHWMSTLGKWEWEWMQHEESASLERRSPLSKWEGRSGKSVRFLFHLGNWREIAPQRWQTVLLLNKEVIHSQKH